MKSNIYVLFIILIFISSCLAAVPVYNTTAIPLNVYSPTNSGLIVGQSLTSGNVSLVVSSVGVQLKYFNKVVWQPFTISPPDSSSHLGFGSDGNLCLYNNANNVYWCTYVYGVGGAYLNILPEGSYGREWGIVIQTAAGKMVWGKFGNPISDAGNLPLIPGNYIKSSMSGNNQLIDGNFITNGQHYLVSNKNYVALQYFTSFQSMNYTAEAKWFISKIDLLNETGLVFLNSSVCIDNRVKGNVPSPIWCTPSSNDIEVYVILPLPGPLTPNNSSDSWCWVTADINMVIVNSFSSTPLPTFNLTSIPLSLNSYMEVGTVIGIGQSLKLANTEIRFTPRGVRFLYKNKVVWQALIPSMSYPTASFFFGSDGNLCMHSSYPPSQTNALDCVYVYGVGGAYLNILPEGSYGREWGIVIQTAAGKMVWGKFGDYLLGANPLQLIPGNFIDRLDPNNKVISLNSFITNGQNYLTTNAKSTEAIGYYLNYPSNSQNASPSVWSVSKTTGSYSMYFLANSSVCVGTMVTNVQPIWCAQSTSINQRYVVVPMASLKSINNADFWNKWVVLSNSGDIVYTQKSIKVASPVYNTDAIPLNVYFAVNSRLVVGQSSKSGNVSLVMTSAGIQLIYFNKVVWQPFTISTPDLSAYLGFGSDGNLCVYNGAGNGLWCTFVYGVGGTYLNILPIGSYGREWGIVIQTTAGKMVWGKFGNPITDAGIIPLIPGSFIDMLDPNNKVISLNSFITNGQNYLTTNAKSTEAIGYYLNYPSNSQSASPSVWSVSKTTGSYSMYFLTNSSVCVGTMVTNVQPIWCTPSISINQRYVVVPLPSLQQSNQGVFWRWVALSENKTVTFTQISQLYPASSQVAIPLTPNSYRGVGTRITVGQSITVGSTQLLMTSSGIQLNYKSQVVWNPFTISPVDTGSYLGFGSDGNLCLYNNANKVYWCLYSNGLGGLYINILPEGSYGRQWGIVIQTAAGKMVWGKFGNSICTSGIIPLIPGSFIDRLDPNNNQLLHNSTNFITNGQEYLRFNAAILSWMKYDLVTKEETYFYKSSYKTLIPSFGFNEQGQFGTQEFSSSGNLVQWVIAYDKSSRYFVSVIPDSPKYRTANILLDDNMKIVGGWDFSVQDNLNDINFVSTKNVSISYSNGLSNYYTKLELSYTSGNIGVVSFRNLLNNTIMSQYQANYPGVFNFYLNGPLVTITDPTNTCPGVAVTKTSFLAFSGDNLFTFINHTNPPNYYLGFSEFLPELIIVERNNAKIVYVSSIYDSSSYYNNYIN